MSALAGPHIGRAFDRFGGRPVLMATSVLFALALVLVATAQDAAWMFAGWALLGLAMCSGLYEGAFATLVRMYGEGARNPITGVTLFGGFASTVGLAAQCLDGGALAGAAPGFGWAPLHLVVALPLRGCCRARPRRLRTAIGPDAGADDAGNEEGSTLRASSSAAGAGFRRGLVQQHRDGIAPACASGDRRGSAAAAVAIASLVGPAQVGGRILEFGLLRRPHLLLSTRVATLSHPAAPRWPCRGAGGRGLRGASRRGQRHPSPSPAHAAAGDLRRRRLWRAAGLLMMPARVACSGGALAVRAGHRALGAGRVVAVQRARAAGLRGAHAAAQRPGAAFSHPPRWRGRRGLSAAPERSAAAIRN